MAAAWVRETCYIKSPLLYSTIAATAWKPNPVWKPPMRDFAVFKIHKPFNVITFCVLIAVDLVDACSSLLFRYLKLNGNPAWTTGNYFFSLKTYSIFTNKCTDSKFHNLHCLYGTVPFDQLKGNRTLSENLLTSGYSPSTIIDLGYLKTNSF